MDLFTQLLAHPPSPDREFTCRCCGVALVGRIVCLDEHARAACADCTGREPEEEP